MNQSKPQRAPIAWFDARSVMLFAALAVGGMTAQAQTTPSPSVTRLPPAQSSAPSPDVNAGPGSSAPTTPTAPAQSRMPTPASSSPATGMSSQQPMSPLDEKRRIHRGSASEKGQHKTP